MALVACGLASAKLRVAALHSTRALNLCPHEVVVVILGRWIREVEVVPHAELVPTALAGRAPGLVAMVRAGVCDHDLDLPLEDAGTRLCPERVGKGVGRKKLTLGTRQASHSEGSTMRRGILRAVVPVSDTMVLHGFRRCHGIEARALHQSGSVDGAAGGTAGVAVSRRGGQMVVAGMPAHVLQLRETGIRAPTQGCILPILLPSCRAAGEEILRRWAGDVPRGFSQPCLHSGGEGQSYETHLRHCDVRQPGEVAEASDPEATKGLEP